MENYSVAIGSVGVGLLLLAFLLNMVHKLKTTGKTYSLMNFLGAAMSCYASYLIHFFPFVVLEAIWALVALAGLWKAASGKAADE